MGQMISHPSHQLLACVVGLCAALSIIIIPGVQKEDIATARIQREGGGQLARVSSGFPVCVPGIKLRLLGLVASSVTR